MSEEGVGRRDMMRVGIALDSLTVQLFSSCIWFLVSQSLYERTVSDNTSQLVRICVVTDGLWGKYGCVKACNHWHERIKELLARKHGFSWT